MKNYIPIFIIPNVSIEEDLDPTNDEKVIHKGFEKSETEIESYNPIVELKYPQEYVANFPIVFIVNGLNEKQINGSRVQFLFKLFSHNNLIFFKISQDYHYELSKRKIHANGNITHIFKTYKFGEVRFFYQDKTSVDMTLNQFILFKCGFWNERYQPLSTDMTKDKHKSRHRLGLNCLFISPTNCFQTL